MFESHPDTQYIFPKFRGIDLTALEQSLVIVQHGSRVMGIVDSVVKNLVNYDVTNDDYDVTNDDFDVTNDNFDVTNDHYDVTNDHYDIANDHYDVKNDNYVNSCCKTYKPLP